MPELGVSYGRGVARKPPTSPPAAKQMLGTVASGVIHQATALGISLADRIALSALLIRVWGVTVFEDWTILFATASLFGLLELGLYMTFSNSLHEACQSGDKDLWRRRTATAMGISLMVLAVGAVLIIAVTLNPDWDKIAAVKQLRGLEGQVTLVLLALAIVLQIAVGPLTTIYRAQGHFNRLLAVNNLLFAGRLGAVGATTIAGLSPLFAAASYLAVTVLWALVFIPLDMRITLRDVRFKANLPTRPELTAILSTAPWYFAQQALNSLLTSIPLLVMPYVSQIPGAIASFIIVRALVSLIRQLVIALANSIGVELARWHAIACDKSLIARTLLETGRFVDVTNAAATTALLFVAGPFISIWSSGKLEADLAVAGALGLGFMISSPFVVTSNFLNYIGDARIGAYSRTIQAGFTLVLGLLLGGKFGIFGVSVALAAGEAIGGGIVYMGATARWTLMSPGRLAGKILLHCLVGGLPIVAVGLAVQAVEFSSLVAELIFRVVCLASATGLVVLGFGMSHTHRIQVWQKVRVLLGAAVRR